MRRWLDRLVALGISPDDTDDTALRKSTLTLSTVSITAASTCWVVMYAALGLYRAALIPLAYQVLSLIGLAVFVRTKNFRLFRFGELVLMVTLPFLLQWMLGGFVKSGAVMVWAFSAPIGGLLFGGLRAGVAWFCAYAALTVASGVIDAAVAASTPPVPTGLSVTFFVMNITVLSTVTYGLLLHFAWERERALGALHQEHARSEGLLLNVLPKPIADRLKQRHAAIADGFPEASVLFADVVDFTRLSAAMTPEATVAWLNELFSELDALSERHGLEKIKTIGDAYMAVAGIPAPRADHAEAAAEMALSIQALLQGRRTPAGEPLRMRIGIHSGPVVAGVIGTKKFIYDLWGDTVNTASRMESHGLAGVIQVTDAAYRLLRGRYDLVERGVIDVKGKGPMRTWLLRGRREAA